MSTKYTNNRSKKSRLKSLWIPNDVWQALEQERKKQPTQSMAKVIVRVIETGLTELQLPSAKEWNK
jgi:hypothetical protein